MEAAALNPPPWLDRVVTLLIPPGAREAVMGDLYEYCDTPERYAREALRISPFVIASQMRRNLNLPALTLQAGLLFYGLGVSAVAVLPLLLLWAAYRPLTRPSPGQALRGAVLVSFSGMALLLLVPMLLDHGMERARPASLLPLFLLGMPLSPLLCILRACLVLETDRHFAWTGMDLSVEELSDLQNAFRRKVRFHNLLEGVAMALSAMCFPMVVHWGAPGMALVAIYGIAALFLLTERTPDSLPSSDFLILRSRYGQELARRQQLRCFLWWLWLAPLLLALQVRLQAGQWTAMQCSIAATLLCFVVAAINREGDGRMREQIGALEQACERQGWA